MSFAVARRIQSGEGAAEEAVEIDNVALPSKSNQLIVGTEGMLVSFARCCRPIPGDDIIAYMSQGKGLTIHRDECPNIKGWEREPATHFPVKWDDTKDKLFISEIRVEIINHQGALAELTNKIAATGANIESLSTEEKDSNLYVINVELMATDRTHLATIMRKIRVMKEIQKVYRRK